MTRASLGPLRHTKTLSCRLWRTCGRSCGSRVLALIDRQAVAELVKGKRIALVGNATSLLDGSAGTEIDDPRHDLVVRFNLGVPDHYLPTGKHRTGPPLDAAVAARARGVRMDVWAGCVVPGQPQAIARALNHPRKNKMVSYYVLTLGSGRNALLRQMWIVPHLTHYQVPEELDKKAHDCKDLLKVCRPAVEDKNPTTGFVACYLLLQHTEVEHIELYGFDFFATLSYPTQLEGAGHNGQAENRWLSQNHHGRVTIHHAGSVPK